tara:strand:- start:3564 stop:8057 length:4494 start_codon:yes stop_codon:yes gene_type:complete
MADELINVDQPQDEEEEKSWWESINDSVIVKGAKVLGAAGGHVSINDAEEVQENNPEMDLYTAALMANKNKFEAAGGYNPIPRLKRFGGWLQEEGQDWQEIMKDRAEDPHGPSGGAYGKVIHYASNLFPEHIGNTIELGTAGLLSDAYRNVADFANEKDLADTPWGARIDKFEEDIYTNTKHKPRSEMTYEERVGDNARAQMMLSFYLMPLLSRMAGGVATSQLATKYPMLGQAMNAMNPAMIQRGGFAGFSEFMLKAGALNIAEGVPHTLLSDNTYGSFASLLLGEKDPALEADGNAEAALKSIVPNAIGDTLMFFGMKGSGAVLEGGAKRVSPLIADTFKNVTRSKIANSFKRNRNKVVRRQIDSGIIEIDENGKGAFGATYKQDGDVNLNAPETTEIEEALSNFASYDDKIQIRDSEGSVPESIETLLNRPNEIPDQVYRYEDVSAPIGSYPTADTLWSNQLGKVPTKNLISLADPNNSPAFADRLLDISGKDYSQATRADIVEVVKSFEAEGKVLMPNRLMGGKILRSDEINVNPEVFQFKGNVDPESGVVLGDDSLAGVERYNPTMEGTLKVWEDNEGGYNLVDGHNRFGLGQKLGIPSYRVEVLDSMTPEGARSQGALANISGGKGTGVDAANFFKNEGITSPDQLSGLGVPLSSGTATKGLALSKLPDNIFRDVVEGNITELKGAAIGGSGLDENAMQQAYKILKDTELTESQLREVLLQAKNAPTVDGQVDLFGNTEQLNLMIEKAKLASAINRTISKDKNLFSRVGSNVERLKTAGTDVDVSEAANQRAIAEQLSTQFNADKYAESEVSKILNEGAIMLSEGGKTGPVSRKIYPRIVKAITEDPTIPVKAPEAEQTVMARKMPTDDELTDEILKKAIKNGEARPPSTPDFEIPEDTGLSYSKVLDDLAEGKISEEIGSLVEAEQNAARQFGKIDDAMEADRIATKRDAAGYDSMTFKEKKNNGLLSTKLKENLKKVAESDARTLRETDELLGPTKKEPFNMQSLKDARATKKRNPRYTYFSLPPGFNKMKPRYGQLTPVFESDLDQVAYIIRSGKKASVREPEILKIVEEYGLTPAEVKRHGMKVHAKIKEMVKEKTGSASASPDNTTGLELTVPNQDFWGGGDGKIRGAFNPSEYGFLDNDFTGGKYNEAATRKSMMWNEALKQKNEAKKLQDWGRRIADSSKDVLRQSRDDAEALVEGMKEASKIAGIPVENIKIVDEIDAIEMFGLDATAGAVSKWDPQRATFMIRNPKDPLTHKTGGEFLGLNLKSETEKVMDGSIYLSLYPAIQNRYKGLASGVLETGRPFRQVLYHEAFHSVQDWLDLRGNKKLLGALEAPTAIKEMMDIITDNRGTFVKNMTNKEIQAESFGWWLNNRRVKLKDGGLKGAFERLKMYLSTFGRKLKQRLSKNPTYIDIFELAASGDIARKTMVQKLTPEQIASYVGRIDADTHRYIPELTERVNQFLFFKKIEFDEAMNRWDIEANSGGCL